MAAAKAEEPLGWVFAWALFGTPSIETIEANTILADFGSGTSHAAGSIQAGVGADGHRPHESGLRTHPQKRPPLLLVQE